MKKKILMRGNDAVAEAVIRAGCRHYYGYPITPQNEIPEYLAQKFPELGGTFVQAESEIAAACMVLGSSAAGVRTMTSTSSPGMTLKLEAISYMSGARLPCVIVNVMRGGPGLGNIAGSQSDYFQATKGGAHGDYQSIVLAPENVQEFADQTMLAFDLSDKYRVVAMVLGDGYLGQMSEPVVLPDPVQSVPKKPWALTGKKGRDQQVLASLRLLPDALGNHNIDLQNLYAEITKAEVRFDSYMTEDADYLIVAYGTCARVSRTAIKALRNSGIKVGLFRPITLWPFPSAQIGELAKKVKKILTIEMCMGQMVQDVRLSVGCKTEVDLYGVAGGVIPDVDKIVERIKSYE
ncbi:MAG: 3-methyl-2-oxobutanoate dehydrogenase subunit VorB [Spirochaetes bacterium]|nr:3-methyl-2-oxobutanoate dehydrogenase subunit VorB [Spirochaetota bacterium]